MSGGEEIESECRKSTTKFKKYRWLCDQLLSFEGRETIYVATPFPTGVTFTKGNSEKLEQVVATFDGAWTVSFVSFEEEAIENKIKDKDVVKTFDKFVGRMR